MKTIPMKEIGKFWTIKSCINYPDLWYDSEEDLKQDLNKEISYEEIIQIEVSVKVVNKNTK